MKALLNWFTGKKTYIAAAVLALLALAGLWDGWSSPAGATLILSLALGFAGLGHKYDRQMAMLVEFIEQNRRVPIANEDPKLAKFKATVSAALDEVAK
jgi:hypothetical protein